MSSRRQAAWARRRVLSLLAALVAAPAAVFPRLAMSEVQPRQPIEISDVVRQWLQSLSPSQRSGAAFPFQNPERFDWHYTPRSRAGLPLKEMTAEQRRLALAVLAAGLSQTGYRKSQRIMALEGVLREIDTFGFFRDPESYYLTVFGEPGDPAGWGWRFEGHHLSLNMTLRGSQLIAATPCFLGANPAVVPVGHLAGLEVLGEEIGIARELMTELDTRQRERAMIAGQTFGDIVAGPGREDRLRSPEGLPAEAMTSGQRDALTALIEIYAGNLADPWAETALERARAAGLDAVHFAWAGAIEPGKPHYFRVHGPGVLIEYDNTRNDANHVHSVWHDPANPFGRDVLGWHYRHGHRHA